MAQVSYGTITITDTNDIEEIFSLYGGSNDANTSPTYSYAAITDGTTWKRNVTAITNYKYIWQITAITKTGITVDSSNWQQFYGAPIRITGEEGDDARNIIAVTPYYYLSSSNSSQTGGNWSTSPQAYPSTGVYYYWTKTITTYDSGSPSESTAVLDMFLTNAAKDARDANANAAIANSIASHANEDAQGALGIARAMQQNFWWWGEDYTVDSSFTLPAGAYTSDIKVDTFKVNPTGGYLVTRSDGIYLNNGRYVLMGLTGNALKFYRPGTTQLLSGTETVDAELTSNGLVLSKGGIESDNSGNGYVYLSTEDKTGITINGHNPGTSDPKWRAIIGSKFGVDAEGNLYAAGAHIDGDIIAQSLTIGSGANAYSGIAAINITGYLIEIEVVDVVGSTDTKKLIPHLLHNGENADSEVADKTDFIWYVDNSISGVSGDSVDGSITGAYGSSYRVIYDFDDGAVEGGTATRTLTVDPSKYITRISDTGITIHPEMLTEQSSWIQLDGNGMELFNSSNESIARYGNTAKIGLDASSRFLINASSLQAYNNNNQLYFEVNANGLSWGSNTAATTTQVNAAAQTASNYISWDSSGIMVYDGTEGIQTPSNPSSTTNNVFVDDNSLDIRRGTTTLATFGSNGSTIGITDGTQSYLAIDYHSMQMYDKENALIIAGDGTGEPYFHVSDLRNTNGMASFAREIITDGVYSSWVHPTFSSYTLEVYLEGVLLTQGVDYYDENATVAFSSPPAAGQTLKIIVITASDEAKAFTFGSRSTDLNHFVGAMSIATGKNVASMGFGAVAEGEDSIAWGDYSHAHGKGTIATFNEEFVVGRYNEIAYQGIGGAFTVGNGSSDSNRSNALTVDWNGNVWAAGAINGLVEHYGAITGATIADKNLSSGSSWQNIGSITLPEGAWLLYLTASFALNGTGYRLLAIADSSAAAGSIIRTNRQTPANGATTSVSINCPLAGGRTYYINGCQNSGTTLKVETRYTAIKIGTDFSS